MNFKFDFSREPVPFLIGLLVLSAILLGVILVGPSSESLGPKANTEPKPATEVFLSEIVKSTKEPSELGATPTVSDASSSVLVIMGQEEMVFDWSEDACEPSNIPDAPARAFRDSAGRVQLILSHYVNYRMIGPDFDHLTIDCNPIMVSDSDPDPAKFNDREWIHALYTDDGNTVYALIHNEHQGHRRVGQCASSEYTDCWYNTITLATSSDGGSTFTHAEPSTHLVAALPYVYEAGAGPFGVFNPSNILLNALDNYYYVLLHLENYQLQSSGSCLMRTQNLADPTSWRAWDGEEFAIRFVNAYVDTDAVAQEHICQPVSFEQIQKMWESVTFNTYLQQFLLIGTAGTYDQILGRVIWGVYYSTSHDLIHWSPRKLLMETERTWTYECGDEEPIASPTVLDPASLSRNFDTTGTSFYLYYTRLHYESCQLTLNRDLVRVPVEFVETSTSDSEIP